MNFGSLFAGGIKTHSGGFDIGFARAGMIPEWEIEITRGKDIRNERPEEYKQVDLICGGPPCQETSRAAALSRKGTDESLWGEMLRFIETIRPNWVVVEQPVVKKDWVLDVIQKLELNNYGVAGRIIDSKHWVPQQRARWFIIGRLEVKGLELWNHLYPDGERGDGRIEGPQHWSRGSDRGCPDCMSDGIYSRISKRRFALRAAGNAVSVPVAKWLGERIIAAEEILTGKIK